MEVAFGVLGTIGTLIGTILTYRAGLLNLKAKRHADEANQKLAWVDQFQEQMNLEIKRRDYLEGVVQELRKEVAKCENDKIIMAREISNLKNVVEELSRNGRT